MPTKFCQATQFTLYKFGNSIRIRPKKIFFEACSWFKFNNLGLAPGMTLKFCTIVAEGITLEFRKFLGLIFTFVEVT